jgi:thymidylate synthase
MHNGEWQYIQTLANVLYCGELTPDRTGVGVLKRLNAQIVFDVNETPLSTSRKLSWQKAWHEMRFFLSGRDDTHELHKHDIYWWDGHTSREFLDSRGLRSVPEGSLVASYSHQFRNSGGIYSAGVDQLEQLVRNLRKDPFSRRHAIDLWSVAEQEYMPLLPCWWRSSWSVSTGEKMTLHLKLHSRSLDMLFGFWMAATQYRMLQIALAKMLNMNVGVMVCDLWDHHIYLNQVDYVKELLSRKTGNAGTISLNKDVRSLEDIIALMPEDFDVIGYEPNTSKWNTPIPPMAI